MKNHATHAYIYIYIHIYFAASLASVFLHPEWLSNRACERRDFAATLHVYTKPNTYVVFVGHIVFSFRVVICTLNYGCSLHHKDWPWLQMSPDSGPDMVCMFHFLVYCLGLCISFNWDPAHMWKNCGKQILKRSSLWKFIVLMTAANNCVYGSMLSPARLFQIREAVLDYFRHTNPLDCPLFMSALPHLVEQLKLDVDMKSKGVEQVFRQRMQITMNQYTKNIYCSLM